MQGTMLTGLLALLAAVLGLAGSSFGWAAALPLEPLVEPDLDCGWGPEGPVCDVTGGPDTGVGPEGVEVRRSHLLPSSAGPGTAAPQGPTPAVAAAGVASASVGALAAWVLYHRFRGSRAAEHPLRAAILADVRAAPGILPSTLAARHGVTLNAILYHVRVLSRERLMVVRGVGPARLLFPVAMEPARRRGVEALRAPLARALLAEASEQHAVDVAGVWRRLGFAESSVRSQLAKLAASGLIAWEPGALRAAFRRTSLGSALASKESALAPTRGNIGVMHGASPSLVQQE